MADDAATAEWDQWLSEVSSTLDSLCAAFRGMISDGCGHSPEMVLATMTTAIMKRQARGVTATMLAVAIHRLAVPPPLMPPVDAPGEPGGTAT